MDQKRIGVFIAECRRAKGLTQQQLAELLGITDKSVSKWETGICLPGPSLYQTLCEILGITISELFAGEKADHSDADAYLIRLLEQRIYDPNSGVTFTEFHHALKAMAETTVFLSQFSAREQAVEYLMQETGLSFDECAKAYDFYHVRDQKK